MDNNDRKRIVLVGQPNCGKSTLFNVLADIKTSTSNYAGTTEEIEKTEINIRANSYELIDIPGTYSLNPTIESERVSLEYLMNTDIDLIINVVDASLLARSLELTVELVELGMPMVIALNMYDLADRRGLDIDIKKLEEMLNIPVIPTQAVHGKGVKTLMDASYRAIMRSDHQPAVLRYTHHMEENIRELTEAIEDYVDDLNGSNRFYAIKALENPEIFQNGRLAGVSPMRDKIEKESFDLHKMDGFETVSYERHHLAMKIAEEITSFRRLKKRPLSERLDDILLHPFWGYGILILFFMTYFAAIFIIGDFLASLVDTPIQALAGTFRPLKETQPFLWHTINGAYLGFAGVVGIVLPYFLPLVLLTSIFEETGYIARIAFLVDTFMHKIGLHGKSVIPFILGFGCSVPAIYATRMIERKTDRMMTAVLIPFIPCSARIAVIFALTAAFTGPLWAMIIYFYVILVIAGIGAGMSKFIKKPLGLILEIPDLHKPSFKVSLDKTWIKIKDFVQEAIIFLVIGSMILGWIEYFHVAEYLNTAFEPLLTAILGLPEELGSTLIFGFFRKELIIVMITQALNVETISALPLTTGQIIVFIIFVTLYFPCFTTFVVIWKEFGTKIIAFSATLSIIIASASAFLFKILLGV